MLFCELFTHDNHLNICYFVNHLHMQIKEQEDKKKEQRRQELETIRIRQAADEIFRRNEEEKFVRKREDAEKLKEFHSDQLVSKNFESISKQTLYISV